MYVRKIKRRGKMKASAAAKLIIVFCIFCLIAGFLTKEKYKPYSEDYTKGRANKAAVIEMEGMIASSADSSFFEQSMNASNMLKMLSAAKDDKNISGIILKINSPGGTVAMSQNIYNKVLEARQSKPVITVFDDLGASGAYYIASASDRIIAQEGTLTGSIGVIFSFMDYHNLLADKLNISNVVIKSGKFKDIGSGTREMTAEERELMQGIIDDSYQQFLTAVRNGRINRTDNYTAKKSVLTEENLAKYADGRIFTGRQAKNLGFIDETGDMETAKKMISVIMQEKYGNKLPASLVMYNKQNSRLLDYMLGMTEYKFNKGMKLSDFLPKSAVLNKRLLYLWE